MRVIASCAALVACAALAACGGPEPAPHASSPVNAPADAGAAAPELAPAPRLSDQVVPLRYALTLEVDPASDRFAGHVAITIAVATPGTRRLWLHAAELEIVRATLTTGGRSAPVHVIDGDAPLRGFALPDAVGPGEPVTLTIDYTGHAADLSDRTGSDEEGLFRERADGRWYLYSQAESSFARRIVPCFDEPRFKPAWQVTAIVPRGQVALGNAPVLDEHDRPDGRREVRFAEIAALPSYLFAIAVGPFELIDAGKLGKHHVPVRLAVMPGDGGKTAPALRVLPRIVDALERYLDQPLPLTKLDLVAVPAFFGAMENPGLITFETVVLVGGRDLTSIAAHELAHQWFGNAVTPAWWDHLWLSEAFATWLADRVTGALGGARRPALAHRTRAQALAADDELDAEPLVHAVEPDDIEPAFDAIAYDKGAAVLAMFERFVGPDAFQAAVRGYVARNAGRAVTSQAFLDALAGASRPEVSAALATNLAHAGTPVVELAIRCGAAPAIVASVRDGVTLPVCVRAPPETRLCFLAGAHTEQPLPPGRCPSWLVGNDGGRGYYRVAWHGVAAALPAITAPFAALSPDERLARGDDLAAAVQHGELTPAGALDELGALARSGDPDGALAALAIARAIDPLVGDAVRPAWTQWLASRFPDRLTRTALGTPRSPVDGLLREQLVALVHAAIDPAILATARAVVLRQLDAGVDRTQLRLAAVGDADLVFDRLVDAAARQARDDPRGDRAADLLEALGVFPAGFAPRVVRLVLDHRFAVEQAWPALAAMLARGETASAAWQALHDQLDAVLARLSADRTRDVIAACASLCDPAARAQVAADFTARARRAPRPALATTLATIDRCIARRAAAGDLAQALRTAGASTPRR
ncbi:MAG: M1 family aminopeptidase [Kofleriaceae bacterium]